MAAAVGGGGQAQAGGSAHIRRSVQRADGEARRARAAGPPQYVHLGAQVLGSPARLHGACCLRMTWLVTLAFPRAAPSNR